VICMERLIQAGNDYARDYAMSRVASATLVSNGCDHLLLMPGMLLIMVGQRTNKGLASKEL